MLKFCILLKSASGEEIRKDGVSVDEIESTRPLLVKKLTPTNITTFLTGNEESFVMFYSPGFKFFFAFLCCFHFSG